MLTLTAKVVDYRLIQGIHYAAIRGPLTLFRKVWLFSDGGGGCINWAYLSDGQDSHLWWRVCRDYANSDTVRMLAQAKGLT